jgi:ribonuclease BN (tRNA processing enzyme)
VALSVTVLGSSGTYAAAGNACSGYLLRSDSVAVWLDCGPGTLANLQQHVALDDLDAVVVTHEHPDHWLELAVLRNALKYGRGREHLPVHGTAGTRRQLDVLTNGRIAPTFDWTDVADGATARIGDLALAFVATDHPVRTMAVVVDHDGRRFAYTADTGPAFDGAALRHGGAAVDFALVEATLTPEQAAEQGTGAVHLDAAGAARVATQAGAARLVLTHLHPDVDPQRQRELASVAFGGGVELAEVHRTFVL